MFKGKVVVVTGSSVGIGAAAAVKFASEQAQVVVLHGRQEEALKNVKAECEKAGNGAVKVHIIVGDITDDQVRKRMIDGTVEQFGRLDVLVNNAAIGTVGPYATTSLEVFDQLMNVNVRSVIALTQLAIPHLAKTKGNIVNISSSFAIKPNSIATFYSASKAALDYLTQCLALEIGPQGIRVNSISPGYIAGTEIATRQMGNITEDAKQHILNVVEQTYPLRRAGNVDETADVILFMASEKARFVTGTIFPVDGGYTKT